MPEKIWLSSPHMGSKERQLLVEAFDSNWIAPLGPMVNAFEERLQTYNGVAHAAALSSGTAALHLGLQLLNVQQGDYVLCQSLTFCGSANPIAYLGAHPVFIDSEPESWNMDPNVLEDAIRTIRQNPGQFPGEIKAIMPVHLYGMPAPMNEVMEISGKYEIPVIEDAAESLGADYDGRKTGSIGQLGAYSFNGNKIITTSGGGALASNRKEWIDQARFLATQARDPAPHYQHSQIGYNYRLSNILAAIGCGQMQVMEKRVAEKRRIFEWYRNLLNETLTDRPIEMSFQKEAPTMKSNRWLSCFVFEGAPSHPSSPESLRLAFQKANIEARPLWKPMHLQPVFQNAHYFGGNVAETLFRKGLCLPSGTNMTKADFERIQNVIEEWGR